MDDILKIGENKPAPGKVSVVKKKSSKSKYTVEQKIAAVEALGLAKKLNEILRKVVEKNET
jgi:hypothetical protein